MHQPEPFRLSLLPLDTARIEQAACVFARAFFHDPLYQWFFPNERTRMENIAALYRFVLSTHRHQTRVSSNALEGIAICETPETHKTNLVTTLRKAPSMVSSVGTAALVRMIRFAIATATIRKQCVPNDRYFLAAIVVEPQQQGRGIGKAMLTALMDEANISGKEMYLETQNPRNIPLYERFGFTVIHRTKVFGLEHVVMKRSPTASSQQAKSER